jgi:hypothetical protein
MPLGPSGHWSLRFRDEFAGTRLDTSRWVALDGYRTNAVLTSPDNVRVADGHLVLTLSSATSGAEISSAPSDGAGENGYTLPVDGFAEARILFPGDGETIFNWPAWWSSGPDWPAAGENDIAEGLGRLTVNYHSPSGAHNQGTIPGHWANAFHVYGLHRKPGACDVYYDGRLVIGYPTDDNGREQSLLLNVGAGNVARYGAGSEVLVDYVRAWDPA